MFYPPQRYLDQISLATSSFLIASGTCLDLPCPIPTKPFDFQPLLKRQPSPSTFYYFSDTIYSNQFFFYFTFNFLFSSFKILVHFFLSFQQKLYSSVVLHPSIKHTSKIFFSLALFAKISAIKIEYPSSLICLLL